MSNSIPAKDSYAGKQETTGRRKLSKIIKYDIEVDFEDAANDIEVNENPFQVDSEGYNDSDSDSNAEEERGREQQNTLMEVPMDKLSVSDQNVNTSSSASPRNMQYRPMIPASSKIDSSNTKRATKSPTSGSPMVRSPKRGNTAAESAKNMAPANISHKSPKAKAKLLFNASAKEMDKPKKKSFLTKNILTNRNQDALYLKQTHRQYRATTPLPPLPVSSSLPITSPKPSTSPRLSHEGLGFRKTKRRGHSKSKNKDSRHDNKLQNEIQSSGSSGAGLSNNTDTKSFISNSSSSSSSVGSVSLRSPSFFSIRSNGGDRKRGLFEKQVEDTKIFIPEKDPDDAGSERNFETYEYSNNSSDSCDDDLDAEKHGGSRVRTRYLSFREHYDEDLDSLLNAD